jgi:class 3 adenylate cyclase
VLPFPFVDQAEPTRSATVSDRVYSSARTFEFPYLLHDWTTAHILRLNRGPFLKEKGVADSDQTAPRPRQDATPDQSERHAEGDRRQVAVLFADLVGFTAFTERSGDEAAYTLMQRVSALMTDVVHEQGGTVKSFTGDGIMAIFGVPAALEDAPLRACRAALLIHKRLALGRLRSNAALSETQDG